MADNAETTTTDAANHDAADNTHAPTTTTVEPEPAARQDTDTDFVAESRKWEALAKKNAKALAKFEEANKSEAEKLAERADTAETEAEKWRGRYTESRKRAAIIEAATTAQSTSPDSVFLHIQNDVELDDDGQPIGIDKAIKALRAREPSLFRDVPAGARDAFSSGGQPPALNSTALEDDMRRAVGI